MIKLPSSAYDIFTETALLPNLAFDDLYQYSIAKYFDLELVTMDADFKKVNDIKIEFL